MRHEVIEAKAHSSGVLRRTGFGVTGVLKTWSSVMRLMGERKEKKDTGKFNVKCSKTGNS